MKWPKEKNPARPVASDQRFRKTMKHVDQVDPVGRLGCILSLARFTGRRESAICGLLASDFLRGEDAIGAVLAAMGMDENAAEHMPHGALRWREESDKMGYASLAPISEAARRALDAYASESPRVGEVPLFPAPGDPLQPISRHLAANWLLRAEKAAQLPKLNGGVFHPYRRLWGSERKHLPDVDVAAVGGGRDTRALRESYQQTDPATALRVVEGGASRS